MDNAVILYGYDRSVLGASLFDIKWAGYWISPKCHHTSLP